MWSWLRRLFGSSQPGMGQIPDRFQMTVEDHFNLTGRGKVVTGTISQGEVTAGNTVFVHSAIGVLEVRVGSVEQENRSLEQAGEGEQVGLLLIGDRLSQVERGNIVSHSDDPNESRG